ncbi:DNA repair protein xrcc3 [Phlyctochytrium planicorne]|nr:DNA repair protein xrcc3 [Phlyctochytrium planicorne]
MFLSSGEAGLDNFLEGGFQTKCITEVFGADAAGKTQLALQLSIAVQLPISRGGLSKGVARTELVVVRGAYSMLGAVYITTEQSFPSHRFHDLLQEREGQQEGFNLQQFSDNVHIINANSMEALQDIIHKHLPQFLQHRAIGLLVVDSITTHFETEESSTRLMERSEKKFRLSAALKAFASTFELVVLCINHAVTPQERTQRVNSNHETRGGMRLGAALGLPWANCVNVRLCMERHHSTDEVSNIRILRIQFSKRKRIAIPVLKLEQPASDSSVHGKALTATIFANYARILRGLGDKFRSSLYFKEALKFSDSEPLLCFELGELAYSEKDYRSAFILFERCLLMGSGNLEVKKIMPFLKKASTCEFGCFEEEEGKARGSKILGTKQADISSGFLTAPCIFLNRICAKRGNEYIKPQQVEDDQMKTTSDQEIEESHATKKRRLQSEEQSQVRSSKRFQKKDDAVETRSKSVQDFVVMIEDTVSKKFPVRQLMSSGATLSLPGLTAIGVVITKKAMP